MEHSALNTYLNDHLAGATLGVDHAHQIQEHNADTPFGVEMARIAEEIEQSRATLVDLMDRLGTPVNPVKKAGAWVAEKAGRVKFSGLSSNDAELGNFLALETMLLGVTGQCALWRALREIAAEHPEIAALDLEGLIARTEAQRDALERERLKAARRAFASADVT
jgi:hypothetical protein